MQRVEEKDDKDIETATKSKISSPAISLDDLFATHSDEEFVEITGEDAIEDFHIIGS